MLFIYKILFYNYRHISSSEEVWPDVNKRALAEETKE
jgi:hypothetical protein